MRDGEFEDTRNQLGDLPDDLARERGELNRIDGDPFGLPADMRRSADARDSAAKVGIGGPVVDYTVRGVYDSRPINSVDFNQTVLVAAATEAQGRLPCLQVPYGFVAVLRKISFSELFDYASKALLPDNLNAYDSAIQITKNAGVVSPINMNGDGVTGAAVQQNTIPLKFPAELDTFIIYDELEVIGVSMSPIGVATGCYVTFYGNLLVKTGIPAPFEVANRGGGKPSTVVATPQDLGMKPRTIPAPRSPQPVRRRGLIRR